jgi:hypothetical protein
MMYLIQKHAPKLMKIGDYDGFSKPDSNNRQWTRRSPEVRKKIIDLRDKGYLYWQIEQETGVPVGTIQHIVLENKRKNKRKSNEDHRIIHHASRGNRSNSREAL